LHIPTGPEWIHELKWDGYRILAHRGAGIHLWSRSALDWSPAFPQIVAALKQLRVMSITLDGEVVCLREDGRPDFNRLRAKEGCQQARLVAFDLLELATDRISGVSRSASAGNGFSSSWRACRTCCGTQMTLH
jgi:bifunctional non-homologous end joining protein LigD